MQVYLRRFAKYLVFFVVIFILVNIPMYIQLRIQTHGQFDYASFGFARFMPMFAIAVAVALIYPVMLFTKKEVYMKGSFAQNRKDVLNILEKEGFLLIEETPTYLLLRPKTKFRRFIAMSEDQLTLEIGDSPWVIHGYKKELIRLYGALSLYARKKESGA